MATFTIVPGAPIGPGKNGNAYNEASLVQVLVNDTAGDTTCGMTLTWVYDNVARTLTCTFSGTAS